MPSGDVRDDRAKSRPQPRRALWQAGQQPRAPRLGVGGPAPGVGGAGATSGPDVSPQPHPGGAGYRRRRRPRRAARARRGRGPRSAHRQDGAAARPRLGRGRGPGQGRAPLVRGRAAGPIRTSGEAASASGPARANGRAPWPAGGGAEMGAEGRARGRTSSEGGGPGRGRCAPSPAAGSPLGIFLPDLCTVTASSPGVEASAGEGGRPFVPSAAPEAAGVGALRRGSPALLLPPASEVCAAGRRVRSGPAQDRRPRPHSRAPGRPRPGTQAAGPSRSFPAALRALGAARPEAGSRPGRGRSRGKHRELRDWPRAGGDPGSVGVVPTAVPCSRERATCWGGRSGTRGPFLPLRAQASRRGRGGFKRHPLRGPRPPRPTHPPAHRASGPPGGNARGLLVPPTWP